MAPEDEPEERDGERHSPPSELTPDEPLPTLRDRLEGDIRRDRGECAPHGCVAAALLGFEKHRAGEAEYGDAAEEKETRA
jgi:hypothetical protein